MTAKRSCVVSLIGRPNVGKSTIFNRLMRKSFKAMTFDQPGVTRDRHYAIATLLDHGEENPQDIILIDTGGFYPEKVEEVKQLGKKKTAEPFFNIMADQAKMAIDESDLVLFVVDVREGLLPYDKTIADYIRTTKKPVWLLVNKFDTDKQWGEEAEFYTLGLAEDHFFTVSAEHGRGLTDLRERLYDFSKDFERNEELNISKGVTPNHDVVGNVSIIGSPNAGKSTLLNRLTGAQRALVSDIAGTTVDPIEGYFDLFFGDDVEYLNSQKDQFRMNNEKLFEEYQQFADEMHEQELIAYGQFSDHGSEDDDDFEAEFDFSESDDFESEEIFSVEDNEKALEASDEEEEVIPSEKLNPYRSIKLVDTAGIRRQKQVSGFIEEQSVYRSLRSIAESDVVIYLVDVTKGITHQDRRLCDIALEKGKSLIICLNKVDLMADVMKDQKRKREWMLDLRATIPWLSFCELITISAKNGRQLGSLKNSLKRTIMLRNKKVGTSKLNKTLSELMDKHPIVLEKSSGKRFRLKYASMLKAAPPTFLLFTNKSKGVPENYRKYLVNGLRKSFNYHNTPIHLIFRTTTDIERRMQKMMR